MTRSGLDSCPSIGVDVPHLFTFGNIAMAAISKADYRLEYAIELGDRLGPQLELTVGEAADMYAAGFTFSIYRPETGEFQLSRPYATARDFARNELRIWQ